MNRVYLDYNATWPLDHKDYLSLIAMLHDTFTDNSQDAEPYSLTEITNILGCHVNELLVTSGGTEGNNILIQTLFHYHFPQKKHFITTSVEHPSILKTAQYIKQNGGEVTLLTVDQHGALDLNQLKKSIRNDTFLVSAMYANNETGVLFPIQAIASICKEHHVEFHTDAVQVLGKLPLSFHELGATYAVISGHKIGAPMGLGFLYAQKDSSFSNLAATKMKFFFDNQVIEKQKYLQLFLQIYKERIKDLDQECDRLSQIQTSFIQWLKQTFQYIVIFGEYSQRISNTINFSIKNIEGESVLLALDLQKIAASSGSACSSGALEPSHVITAMGYLPEVAHGAVRLSFGKSTSAEEIEYLKATLKDIILRLQTIH